MKLAALLFASAIAASYPSSARASETQGWVPTAKFEEIPNLKRDAMRGSSTAARRLASYYMKFPNDIDTYEYWYQIAAENGGAAGQRNYGLILGNPQMRKTDLDGLSGVRARFWLERAAAQGDQHARDRLVEMDRQAAK